MKALPGDLQKLYQTAAPRQRAVLETAGTTIQAGKKQRKYIGTDRRGLGASAGAGAGARLRGGSEKVARVGSGGHHERVLQSLGSGALKYACDAKANWETMHVSVKLQWKARATTLVSKMSGARDGRTAIIWDSRSKRYI
eukprot:3220223-Pleurochrysis_carterae.AAC.1